MSNPGQEHEQHRPAETNGNRDGRNATSRSFTDPFPADKSSQQYQHISPPRPPMEEDGSISAKYGADATFSAKGSPLRQYETTWYARLSNPQTLQFLPAINDHSVRDINAGWVPVSDRSSIR